MKRVRRLGLFGGAFDPPHLAHLALARAALEQLGLDELRIIPTGQAWHKARALTAPEHRLAMARLAFADLPGAVVDGRELARSGPTYTVDTLRDLRALNPDTDLFFITGADALGQILTWRDSEELFSLAHFVGVTRPGHQLDDAGLPEGGVSLVEVPALAISSTDCRARVAKKDPIWYLVPDGVVRYIDKRELYRGE